MRQVHRVGQGAGNEAGRETLDIDPALTTDNKETNRNIRLPYISEYFEA